MLHDGHGLARAVSWFSAQSLQTQSLLSFHVPFTQSMVALLRHWDCTNSDWQPVCSTVSHLEFLSGDVARPAGCLRSADHQLVIADFRVPMEMTACSRLAGSVTFVKLCHCEPIQKQTQFQLRNIHRETVTDTLSRFRPCPELIVPTDTYSHLDLGRMFCKSGHCPATTLQCLHIVRRWLPRLLFLQFPIIGPHGSLVGKLAGSWHARHAFAACVLSGEAWDCWSRTRSQGQRWQGRPVEKHEWYGKSSAHQAAS